MSVIDTNILIYAADRDSRFHDRSRSLVEEWRESAAPWYLTWGILYEFLRVTTHIRVLREPWTLEEAMAFVDALLAAPAGGVLVPTGRHADVLGEAVSELPELSGNIVHEVTTAVLMREHGIRHIYTPGLDFHRFPWVEVMDPLSG